MNYPKKLAEPIIEQSKAYQLEGFVPGHTASSQINDRW